MEPERGTRRFDLPILVTLRSGDRLRGTSVVLDRDQGVVILFQESPGIRIARKLDPAEIASWQPDSTDREELSTAPHFLKIRPTGCTTCRSLHTVPSSVSLGTVIGERGDPLDTTRGLVDRYFPQGVALQDVPFVHTLLRERMVREVLDVKKMV